MKNECYHIEKLQYDKQILSVQGWIFSGTKDKQNAVCRLSLLLVSSDRRAVRCRLRLTPRQDVAQVYGLSYDSVGFSFQEQLKIRRGRIRVYLSYSRNWQSKQVFLFETEDSMQAEKAATEDADIEVVFPRLGAYECMDNFWLLRKQYALVRPENARGVDVILPVYNGYSYLEPLFATVFQTELAVRLIVVNDCSTDHRVHDFFKELCRKDHRVVYVVNEQNEGFVKSVNRGFRMAERDVALINTDIELPAYWLERLMLPIFTDAKVASATPYTNCGTLCSFPQIGMDNPVFDNQTVRFVDDVFRTLKPVYTTLPTGVGFCMGIRKKALDQIGLFDEESFKKGYGEENDWCQRAIQAGYQHVQVENLFVYHKHGGSFLPEEKKKLAEENMQTLKRRYPHYLEDAARYLERDANRIYRTYALWRCLIQTDARTILYFNHVLGGGADDYLRRQKEALEKTDAMVMEFCYDAYEDLYRLKINYHGYVLKLYAEHFETVYYELKQMHLDEILINELVVYPNLYDVLERIVQLKRHSGAKLVMLLHDYFCVCPTITLVSGNGIYCGMECGGCDLRKHPRLCSPLYVDIHAWREHWGKFLRQCDSIRAFSDDTAARLQTVYGRLPEIRVKGHKTEQMYKVTRRYKLTDTVNLAVLGVLGRHKGLHIVKEMLALIEKERLPVRIVVVGISEETMRSKHLVTTGRYCKEELPGLMYVYDIDMVFVPSVCPETFSYTAQEAMNMQMPTAVFNLGAPAERVKQYEKGLVISQISAEKALRKMLAWVKQNGLLQNPLKKNILFVTEYESFSSRYRVSHFREHLSVIGICSDLVALKKLRLSRVKKYDVISFYRCSDTKKLAAVSKQAKKYGVRLFYDLDDFIFDYEKIQHLEFLKGEDYRDFEAYSQNIRACMQLCDVLTTSTDHLADAMRESFPGKEVLLCRNAASLAMQRLSESAAQKRAQKKAADDAVVLGYFSGSKTHERDWQIVERCILALMEQNPKVELVLAGTIQVSEQLLAFGNRVRRVPFMDWRRLPELIASIDINLMPLEDHFFQWCKSENKWMEAGLAGVATAASYNPELAGVLRDGYDVVFSRDQAQWQENLHRLAADQTLRQTIGRHAREAVYQTHLVTCEENFRQVVSRMCGTGEGLAEKR